MNNTESYEKKENKALSFIQLLLLKTVNFIFWLLSAIFLIVGFMLYNSQGFLFTAIIVIGSIMIAPSFKRILTHALKTTPTMTIVVHLLVTGIAFALVSFTTKYMYSQEKQNNYVEQFKNSHDAEDEKVDVEHDKKGEVKDDNKQ